jgi:hypothetical protein|tara:strand:+ start:675 stop:815 length:141 start_codon:yes stop_codon:yes gene_type:complete
MKKILLLSGLAIILSLTTACSGDKEEESSPMDGQPVPAPDKPDIPK